MKIALCDDDINFIKKFGSILNEKIMRYSDDFSITEFTNGKEFIAELDKFDAVFLDIDMPEISGLDVAAYINKNARTLIIFVTSYDELVYSSIKFQPFRFLRKTHLDDELDEAVKSICERLKTHLITVKTKDGETVIDINDLVYIEVFGHKLVFHCANNSIESSGSLSTYEKAKEFGNFLRVHNGYLVNCKFVYSIETNCVIMDDKSQIPLSRHRADNVKKKFSDYLRLCL